MIFAIKVEVRDRLRRRSRSTISADRAGEIGSLYLEHKSVGAPMGWAPEAYREASRRCAAPVETTGGTR